MSEHCCCFESDLFNELVDTVHKTDLNNWFVNQTDPVLKFITQWLKDLVLVLNSSLKEEDKNNLNLITTVNNDLNFCLFITQNYSSEDFKYSSCFYGTYFGYSWSMNCCFIKNNTANKDDLFLFFILLGRREWATVTALSIVTWRGPCPRKKCALSTQPLSRQPKKSSECREDTEHSQKPTWWCSTFYDEIHRCSCISLWQRIKCGNSF